MRIIDSGAGASALTVRITVVEEDDEGMLSITAEDFFGLFADRALPADQLFAILLALDAGVGGSTAAPAVKQASGGAVGGFVPNWSAPPGDVNTLIFEPPAALLSGDLEIWIAMSGGSNWGGAQVWISSDGNSYAFAGTVSGPAVQGVLAATIGNSGSSPG